MEELTEEFLISRASHELKTPLTIIKTHAELLRDKQEALCGRPERLAEAAEALAEAADRLQGKLEELLGQLRAESAGGGEGGLPLDPRAALEAVAAELASRSGREVEVREAGRPVELRGDPGRLKEGLGRLLEAVERGLPPEMGLRLRLVWEGEGWSLGWDERPGGSAQTAVGLGEEAGLDLYCALRAVRACGGRLEI